MMREERTMIQLYQEQWERLKYDFGTYILWLSVAFLVSIVLSFIVMVSNERLLFFLVEKVFHMFQESDLLDPDLSNLELAWGLFLNNTRACLTIFAFGFIPIFILPVGALIMNAGVIGVILAFIQKSDQSVWAMIFQGLLPHGIFELPAIIISTALSVYMSVSIWKKLNDSKGFSLKVPIVHSLKTLGLVCIPLLVIAAIIEAFVTPLLLNS
jgi:stage II sporulation protein M